jgi:hypothetical protein
MMNGRNNGKKIMAVRIVQHAFEIIHLVTEQNPIQVLGEQPHRLDRIMEANISFQSMLSSTLVPEKIPPELVRKVPLDVKPSMCLLSGGSTKRSPY